jgi:hypothetical protein
VRVNLSDHPKPSDNYANYIITGNPTKIQSALDAVGSWGVVLPAHSRQEVLEFITTILNGSSDERLNKSEAFLRKRSE